MPEMSVWGRPRELVKNNNDELVRVSQRIEHVVLSIEESRDCDVIRSEEYNDALTTIFEYVTPISRKLC